MSIASVPLLAALSLGAAPAAPADGAVDARRWPSPEGTEVSRRETKAAASSTLCEGKNKKVCHDAARLLDADPTTAWCEGAEGDGSGTTLTFDFPGEVELTGFEVVPYYGKDFRRAVENGRPSALKIQAGGKTLTIRLEDLVALVEKENREKPLPEDEGPCGDETCATRDERIQGGERLRVAFGGEGQPPTVKARQVVVTLTGVHAGRKYQDTCLSEFTFFAKAK